MAGGPQASALLVLLSFCGLGATAELDPSKLPPAATVKVDFQRDIQPIFEKICWRCHGPERPKSGFRLDNRESALKGGDNGIDIIPGDSGRSPLIHYVARVVPDMEMPPEGKGDPLSPEEVGVLRAWIDQGVAWSTNPPARLAFSASPTLGFIAVDGDKKKFREIEGVRDGFNGGLERFSLHEQTGPDKSVTVEGHVLFPDDDIEVKVSLDKTGVGFVRMGFEQWRKYYDDTGGYYRPFPVPSFDLDRDLHLDIGRAWIDFGLTRPHLPQVVLGYEYRYRDGAKSLLEWGSVNGKNIYPAAEEIHEYTHIFKLNLSYEINEWRIEDNARVEIYDLKTGHENAAIFTGGWTPDTLVRTREGATHVQGMNTITLERHFTDWLLLSGGYLYSRLEGDFSLNQTTTDSLGIPTSGHFWSAQEMELSREAHVFDLTGQVLPLPGLSLSLGFQSEWQRQKAFGDIHLDEGDPTLPQLFLLQPATVQSGLDKWATMENVGLRYTKVPFTVLFAEARLQQESLSQFEEEAGDVADAFLRDTDATNRREDLRTGFNFSAWRWMSLTADYRKRISDTDYDHFRRFVLTGDGYSAFINHREIDTDEAETKLTLRPASWVKLALTYHRATTDYRTATSPVGNDVSPGGELLAGTYLANTYGMNATLTPWQQLRFSGAFTYSDSRTATAQHGTPSVVPYQGSVYTLVAGVTYAWTKSRDLQAAYSFSEADYGEHNVADGLPLGLTYTRHGLSLGLTERLTPRVTATLRYRFYSYSEPSTGGLNDYTAHGVFATLSYKWL